MIDPALHSAHLNRKFRVTRVDHVHVNDDLVTADVLRVHFQAADTTRQIAAIDATKLERFERTRHLRSHLWLNELMDKLLRVLPNVRP